MKKFYLLHEKNKCSVKNWTYVVYGDAIRLGSCFKLEGDSREHVYCVELKDADFGYEDDFTINVDGGKRKIKFYKLCAHKKFQIWSRKKPKKNYTS